MHPIKKCFKSHRPSDASNGQRLTLEALEERMMLSSVQIFAAGSENTEAIQLQIGDAVVRTWDNIGGNANTAQYQTLTHTTPGTVTPGQIRINFIDDRWDPGNNIDENVRIDAIVVDGVRYESEDASVFSTGTWKAEDGIAPGFRQSEFLHASGYFQFADPSGQTTAITVNARGTTGQESFALQVDGNTVGTRNNINTATSSYNFTVAGDVTPDRVRVVFLNDLFDTANNIDRNLVVDDVVIGGVQIEAESAQVFSTGTWTAADGIVDGFGRGDTLHANGYFQFASDTPVNGGNFSIAQTQYTVSEGAGTVTVRVVRNGGSDGTVSLDFQTLNNTAIAGQDYVARSGTLTFLPGQTSKNIVIQISDDNRSEPNERFNVAIDNIRGPGTLLAPRTTTIVIDDNDSVQGTGNGLRGEYFNNRDLTNRVFTRIDNTVNFNWGSGSPDSRIGANTFSVRWTGTIEPRFSERYTFTTRSDDGVRLFIDGRLIIDQWNDHAPTNHTGSITLEAGVQYDIRMEYYENAGGATAALSWQSASQALQVIPRSQLYAAAVPPLPGDSLRDETFISGLTQPTSFAFSEDGRTTYIAEKSGIVKVARDGNVQSTPFIDISRQVNNVRDRGLLDIAIHPDFENNPYVYLLFTYDPPEVFDNVGDNLAGPDRQGNRAGRLIRVTANAANGGLTAVAGSEVVLLGRNSTWNNFNGFVNSTNDFTEPPAGIRANGTNINDFIASDSESHTVGALAFGIDGNLFVSIGDGTSFNRVDPRTVRVQDIDNLSGKVLRINPINGQGLSDNPFYNGNANANRSKVYQLGLRNPFRMSVDPATGQLYVGDVGWTRWEEVNAAGAGANFGWPYFEGGNGTSLRTGGYQNLPEAQAFYNSGQSVTASTFAFNHADDGINAITLGAVYRGTAYPAEFQNSIFAADLGQGIIRALKLDSNGNVTSAQTFSTGNRIVVKMVQGPDGTMYYADLDDGKIGRWTFV